MRFERLQSSHRLWSMTLGPTQRMYSVPASRAEDACSALSPVPHRAFVWKRTKMFPSCRPDRSMPDWGELARVVAARAPEFFAAKLHRTLRARPHASQKAQMCGSRKASSASARRICTAGPSSGVIAVTCSGSASTAAGFLFLGSLASPSAWPSESVVALMPGGACGAAARPRAHERRGACSCGATALRNGEPLRRPAQRLALPPARSQADAFQQILMRARRQRLGLPAQAHGSVDMRDPFEE